MPSLSTYTNGAVYAVNASAQARRSLTASMGRLSTGIRTLNGNDPAGQAVASNITTQARSANVAARNAEDGISVLQAAEGVLLELATLNTRLRELAVQKLNSGFLSAAQENAITIEENHIVTAAAKISESTLNDRELLSPFLLAINNRGTLHKWDQLKNQSYKVV